ncbi:MAG: 16S rRNA (guanine(966)-N(2))-methyltransferase RsmD [Gammaproteobacteria bacterium]|nr:16S rRNA (guanine(966)-N(2))-methyltransferase RsmD [Gammaproteobacteria bacterium]
MARKPTRNRTQKTGLHQTNRASRLSSTEKQGPPRSEMGEVRIIGGDWRGRKLPVLLSEGLRPTSDRVRETVFNWLQFDVPGARCLDLFSGSGALGFEALSRGAKSVTFLELSSPVAKQLSQNLITLQACHGEVVQGDSLQWLARPVASSYDIVFVDPPFNQGLMQQAVDKLFISGVLSKSDETSCSWLYLEQERTLDWPTLPNGWVCHREKKTSNVKFGLFYFKADE